MPQAECTTLERVLLELDRTAPEVPLLALGQTVFWDEPMKAGVALKSKRLGSKRRFLAGIHDTDYFAKISGGRRGGGRFKTLPHNDTTTRGLWSAAGEFSALFGSETVVTREALAAAGVRVDRVLEARPHFLDEITEAYGWRGIVALDDRPPVSAELPAKPLMTELLSTFRWAAELSLGSLDGQGKESAQERVEFLLDLISETAEQPSLTLSQLYEALAPAMYEFAANTPVPVETTATSKLLQFNAATCGKSRFEILGMFVDEETRAAAAACYNEAIKNSPGLYELARFGTGAIPFDMIIPGEGRGTIRLGKRGAVIMTPNRQFLSYKKPLRSLQEFADLVELKFGKNCVIVGKAVSLIGMLAREFIFVFHEGASSYVKFSRLFHNLLESRLGRTLDVKPILRIRYSAWNALTVCCSWLKLPEVFVRPFGTEELCAPSFAKRWKEVGQEQEELLTLLGGIKRPLDLIRYLDSALGGSWKMLAEEYKGLDGRLGELRDKLKVLDEERDRLYARLRELRRKRVAAEAAKGDHWRSAVFEKTPSEADLQKREQLTQEVFAATSELHSTSDRLRSVRRQQHELAEHEEVKLIHDRRRSIEIEAELKRARLVRSAIVSSRGLALASRRPAAWWFPLVCPDGLWFRETIESCEAYLEPLRG